MLVSRRPNSQATNDRAKRAIEGIIEVTKDRNKHGSQASNVDATKNLLCFYYRSEHRSQDRSKVRRHRRTEHRGTGGVEASKKRTSKEHRRIEEARSIKANIEASAETRTVEASTVEASTIEARYGSINARY